MHPSASAIEWIKSYVAGLVGGWSLTDDEIVAAANERRLDNPTPQPTIKTPFWVSMLVACLDPAAIGKLRNLPSLPRILDDVRAQDQAACHLWIMMMLAAGDITQEQHDAMAAIIDAVGPDPDWPSKVGAARVGIGRDLDTLDVAAARSN